VCGLLSIIIHLYNNSFSQWSEFMLSVPRVHGHKRFGTTPLADSGINDRLVKLRPLIDQTCFEFISVSCFVVCYFQRRIFNITKLLYYVAPSVESMMHI